jgi:hydrogenase nickel incorporation protein HypB
MHHIDVRIEKDIFDVNNRIAQDNASRFRANGVRAIDLLGAIGSGKTALIEKTVPLLKARGLQVGAIAGDVYGDDDYQRIKNSVSQ